MKLKKTKILSAILACSILLAGCSNAPKTSGQAPESGEKLKVVATTTMLTDLAHQIGGDKVDITGLMGPGIDPHLYQASAGDVSLLQNSDVIIYNGLHLEGKMGELFEKLGKDSHRVICIQDGLDESKLLPWEEEDAGGFDPHIWFDVTLWEDASKTVATGLAKADPDNQAYYEKNLQDYLVVLTDTHQYILDRAKELADAQRVLITAHDAFQYFGKAYGFQVRGLQGVSTDAEAGTSDVSQLADFIAQRQIKAIFVESSVPPKTIEALQAAVKAKGFDVAIGGELYSDSLGDKTDGHETYVATVKANIDTIVDALK